MVLSTGISVAALPVRKRSAVGYGLLFLFSLFGLFLLLVISLFHVLWNF